MTTNNPYSNKSVKTLMIAEDHVMTRKGLERDFKEHSNRVKVIGSVENGLELLELVQKEVPDFVLLDLTMPLMGGLEILKKFKQDYPSIKSIIYSSDYTEYLVAQTVLLGAAAYIDKLRGNLEEIIKTIDNICAHGYYFTELAALEIIKSLDRQKKIFFLIENQKFSEREIEIIKQICLNKQVKQIANDLNISRGAVKYHKSKLFEKTESEATVELVTYAIQQGIFNPSRVPDKEFKPKY
jgi:two-component system, NarL family, response regulator, fimbrial Z protein, FimZ